MATSKQAGNKTAVAVKKAAINEYPTAAIESAMNNLALSKQNESIATDAGTNASLDIMRLAETYSEKAHKIVKGDTSSVLDDWRENTRALALIMAASGSPFAETSLAKNGDTIAKLTGTGNNVMSIAKGVVDFKLNVDDCQNDEGAVTYRTVRQAVEAKRAERRLEADPVGAAIAAAKDDAREAWKELSKAIFATDDVDLIATLADALRDMGATQAESVAAVEAIEAEAVEAEAA